MSAPPASIRVRVTCALAGEARQVEIDVPAGLAARQIVRQAVSAGLSLAGTGLSADDAPLGVHGRLVADGERLLDGDRLELYRPLQQDPMARRRREAARGARTDSRTG